jgi:two-component system nitrate/nitrite response regulator NarL
VPLPAERRRAASRRFAPIAPQSEESLTKREREILSCLAEGQSTAAIAMRFSISRTTVRNHVQAILRKLAVHSRLAAVVFAYQRKLI